MFDLFTINYLTIIPRVVMGLADYTNRITIDFFLYAKNRP